MISAEVVAARLREVEDRCAAAGNPGVSILGVTKGHRAGAIVAAARAGLTAIGESYAQELVAKRENAELAQLPNWPAVHFIGGLQRNKVRRLAGIVDVWQAVDRVELVDELAARAPAAEVLVQVDISGEASKGGCSPQDVVDLVKRATDAGLRVSGLMGIGPFGDPEAARPGFVRLRSMVDRLGLAECSMGMSGDLEVAVEEGSTMIRIGTDLFGPRPSRR